VGKLWSRLPDLPPDGISKEMLEQAEAGRATCKYGLCWNECYPSCPNKNCAANLRTGNQRIQKWTPDLFTQNFIRIEEFLYAKRDFTARELLLPLVGAPTQPGSFAKMGEWLEEWFRCPTVSKKRAELFDEWVPKVLKLSGKPFENCPAWRITHSCFPNSVIRVWKVQNRFMPAMFAGDLGILKGEAITIDRIKELRSVPECGCGAGKCKTIDTIRLNPQSLPGSPATSQIP
jgi:hypothetical protein